MAKAFASQGDLADKKISFTEIGTGLYAFTAVGDPNSGVIIGDASVMVIEAQATPRLAQKVIDCIRAVTDKPISHVVLTHYHAVRCWVPALSTRVRSSWVSVAAPWSSNAVPRIGQANFNAFPACFRAMKASPV